jgi:hypothetical protein
MPIKPVNISNGIRHLSLSIHQMWPPHLGLWRREYPKTECGRHTGPPPSHPSHIPGLIRENGQSKRPLPLSEAPAPVQLLLPVTHCPLQTDLELACYLDLHLTALCLWFTEPLVWSLPRLFLVSDPALSLCLQNSLWNSAVSNPFFASCNILYLELYLHI